MTYYLLKYEDNWADEIDVDGHVVLNETEYKAFQDNLKRVEDFCFGIGSNEEIEYETREEIESVISVEEISEADYAVLDKLGLLAAGFAPDLIEQLSH